MASTKGKNIVKVTISLPLEVKKGMDRMARAMNMTRSGLIVHMVKINEAMSSNPALNALLDVQITGIMNAIKKKGGKQN